MQDLENDDVIDNDDADNGQQAPEDRGDELDPNATTETLDAVIGDEGDDEGGDDAGSNIPRGRFNEVIEERNWLREQLAAARGQSGDEETENEADEPEPFDFDAKERDYMSAVYEGDQDKAIEIRREINGELRNQAEGTARQTLNQRQMEQSLGQVAAQAVEDYPFLNSEAEGANADAIEMTLSLRQSYEAGGKAPHEALAAAVKKVGPLFAPKDTGDTTSSTQQADRVRRNAQASASQPPSLKGGGVGDRAADALPDITEMTEEQFEALSERDKARLRGDVVN